MFFKHDVWFLVQDFYIFLLFSTKPAFLGISPTVPGLPPHQFLQLLKNQPGASSAMPIPRLIKASGQESYAYIICVRADREKPCTVGNLIRARNNLDETWQQKSKTISSVLTKENAYFSTNPLSKWKYAKAKCTEKLRVRPLETWDKTLHECLSSITTTHTPPCGKMFAGLATVTAKTLWKGELTKTNS